MSGAPALETAAEALLARRLEQRILPGLERMQRGLEALAHPEKTFTSVLVLGTNGKGSTAVLLAELLRAHGLSVGLYTSPHLVRVEERIRVDGANVAPARLSELVHELGRFPDLSYFETLTCAAFQEFAERRVGIAVLEAGLGGRWDATNAADPAVALLTNVGTDHQKWLGETRTAIAAEKAAALRGREAIVATWDDEVEPVIRCAADPATPLSVASQWADVTGARGSGIGAREKTQRVRFAVGGATGEARLPLLGGHQVVNLQLALAGLAALARHGLAPRLDAGAIRRGLAGATWPARMQWCSVDGRRLLVDGAHNREAIGALVLALDEMGLSGRLNLLFACLNDKPLEAMAAELRSRVRAVTVVPLDSPRATPVETLAAAFPGCAQAASVGAALAALPDGPPTLVTGSLRLAGAVLAQPGVGDA